MKEKFAKRFKTENPKALKFYFRPRTNNSRNLGEPVFSSVNCHTSYISRYLDYQLQFIVKEIPSSIKDTKNFYKKLTK